MSTNQSANEHKLEQIKADIISNNVCPDLAQGATQLVMGHGNANADIVFIGEAPGKNEDLQGIPFVGAAGKLLDEMLAQSGIVRADVYITNIVKYRPPNNRDPLPDEKRAFWPYLLRELKIIQPKVVVTLGRHSMEYFLPAKKITEVHGKAFPLTMRVEQAHGADELQGATEQRTETYQEYVEGVAEVATKQITVSNAGVSSSPREPGVTSMMLVPLYHPAAALYNGSLRQTLFDDFSTITNIITN